MKNGCGTVLIIDGNMKNHRAVCAASEAGHIQYAGLDGSVKTGCTNTPNQKNRFCSTHIPRTLLSSSAKHHRVIESILEKKTTRSHNSYKVTHGNNNDKFYIILYIQVLWLGMDDCHVTWEREEDIPREIIHEYETQVNTCVIEMCTEHVGQTCYTLNVSSQQEVEPAIKRPKCDRVVLDGDNGYVSILGIVYI